MSHMKDKAIDQMNNTRWFGTVSWVLTKLDGTDFIEKSNVEGRSIREITDYIEENLEGIALEVHIVKQGGVRC